MRKTLHIHMLIQLLGFSHPKDLFQSNIIPDTFRRLWLFMASVSFRSTEGYAVNTEETMSEVAKQQLLPLTKKQCGMIGEDRVRAAHKAQLLARDVSATPITKETIRQMFDCTSQMHANTVLSASPWSARSVVEMALAIRKAGNHVCRPDVYHKGRMGRKGFCRMLFWRWARSLDTKTKKPVARTIHGLELHPR